MTTGKQHREDAGDVREAEAGRAQSGPARTPPRGPRAPQGQRKPAAADDDDERVPAIDDEEE